MTTQTKMMLQLQSVTGTPPQVLTHHSLIDQNKNPDQDPDLWRCVHYQFNIYILLGGWILKTNYLATLSAHLLRAFEAKQCKPCIKYYLLW